MTAIHLKATASKFDINSSALSLSQIPDFHEMEHYLFVEYSGQGHLHPQRVPSARSKDVASLKLSVFSPDHVSYLKESSKNLTMLDLSGSNLSKISLDLIVELKRLQILILDNNQLSDNSFCKEFSAILGRSLTEISICDNHLTSLLPNIDNFVKLTRLKLSNNAISNLKGLEKLKSLKLLMLEANDLSQLGPGFYLTKRLENVYLCHNQVTSLSASVRNLVHLRELDLSNNALKTVPSELFLLPRIEILKLNNNKINKVPKFKITSKLNSPISFVDLSFNSIVRFPDSLLRICEELDLSNNKIKTVLAGILQKISYQSAQRLHLANNPLTDPPKEICESGLKCMVQYYEEFEGTDNKYQGVKIFSVGAESVQRRRVVNLITDSGEDDPLDGDSEDILECFEATSKSLNCGSKDAPTFPVKFLNMSSRDRYFDLLSLFLTSQSLNLIFVDIDNWREESFERALGCWLWSFIVRHNEAIFLLVGLTKNNGDLSLDRKCEDVKCRVAQLFAGYTERIAEEIENIESQEKITAEMSQSLKRFIQLKSLKVVFDNNLVRVDTTDPRTIKRLSSDIMKVVTNKRTFPNVADHVPSFWSDVQVHIEEECFHFPIISFKEFEVLLQQKFNLKSSSTQVAKYLHDAGSILWWQEAGHSSWIVTSPQILLEVCQLLFQSNLQSYLEDVADPDKNGKRFKKRYPNSRLGYRGSCEVLLRDAILLPELTVVLLESVLPVNCCGKMLFFLCQCWNLGYIVDYAGVYCGDWSSIYDEDRDHNSDVTSSKASQENVRKSADSRRSVESRRSHESKKIPIPAIFLPLFSTKNACSDDASSRWKMETNLKITIQYHFPIGFPRLIFDQAIARINDRSKFAISILDHWLDGFQAEIKNEPIHFRIKRSRDGQKEGYIRYSFLYRGNQNSDEAHRASEVWKWMHGILINMDELLHSYQGLWFNRTIKCPLCKELSFPGTWHIDNGNESSSGQSCGHCGQSVAPHLLEPPKVSKNLSAAEIIRNIRKQFDRE